MTLEAPRIDTRPLQDRIGAYLAEQKDKILELSGPALAAGQEEPIHKVRVALRRARSVFRAFAPHFRKKRCTRADRRLRRLARRLGVVRDLDALRERLEGDSLSSVRAAHPDGIEVLSSRLRAERERRAAELPRRIDHQDLAGVRRRVDRAILDMRDPGTSPWEETRAQVLRFLSEVKPLLREAADPQQKESQHRLRIETKRMRYALEVLDPLLEGRAQPAIEAAREVQDALGFLQDLSVLGELCLEMAPNFPTLVQHLEEMRARAHAEMLRGPGLDHGLLALLGALAEGPSPAAHRVRLEVDA